jgi:hypothetical protein
LIKTLKISGLVALFATAVVMAGVMLAPSSYAGTLDNATGKQTFQTLKGPTAMRVAGSLKTPGKRTKKLCNGKTTTECCKGLSYCGCYYLPGTSDDTHPTGCKSNPPPKG